MIQTKCATGRIFLTESWLAVCLVDAAILGDISATYLCDIMTHYTFQSERGGSILILYCYPCRQAREFLVCDKFWQGRFGRNTHPISDIKRHPFVRFQFQTKGKLIYSSVFPKKRCRDVKKKWIQFRNDACFFQHWAPFLDREFTREHGVSKEWFMMALVRLYKRLMITWSEAFFCVGVAVLCAVAVRGKRSIPIYML